MKPLVPLSIFWFALSSLSLAQTSADRIPASFDTTTRVTLPNSVHPAVVSAASSQPVDPSLPMEHMILSLQPSPSQQAALQALVAEQQDPSSPSYHKFLTTAQFAAQFGVSSGDIAKITSWLSANGFRIDEVAPSNLSITFSGDAAHVAYAFGTEIRQYAINGKQHFANATPTQIPAAFAPVVEGLVKLHDFHSKASSTVFQSIAQTSGEFTTSSNAHYLAPADYGVIYDLNPLYSAAVNGASESIAVIGRSNVHPNDIALFRSSFALPASAVVPVLAAGTDPGVVADGDSVEATLDVEWAGAIAPKATVKLVIAPSTNTTDGIDIAAQYAVNNNVAPIISVSFGACEADINNAFYNNLWQQAAAEGISVLVAAGDSGAAGCDDITATTGAMRAVNGLCSTPYDTCVGGTMFNDTTNPGEYWHPGNNAVMGSAISYIPEKVWNESALNAGGTGLVAGGGGVSIVYSKPAWQSAPGVPSDGHRDVPDVSLTAASHDGYLIYYNGALGAVGGTSASTPSFAGMAALIDQKYGSPQGNLNPTLYTLATVTASSAAPPVFHDITSGNNSVPGVTGFTATQGYDEASGLGSMDAGQLVNQWTTIAGGFTLSASAASVTAAPGQNGAISITMTDVGSYRAPVSLSISKLPNGVTAYFTPGTLTATGSSQLILVAAGTATAGTYPLTVTATGAGFIHTVNFNLVVNVTTNCTMTALPASLSVVQDQATSTQLVCTNQQGTFSGNLSLAVSGLPTGMTSSLSSASLTPETGISTLIVYPSKTTTPGTYNVVVTATLPNATPAFSRTVTIPVKVNAPSTFNITPSATTVAMQQGGKASLTLTSVHSGSFNSAISLVTSGLPSAIAASLSASTIAAPGDGSITINLQSTSDVPAGSYSMTILASGGGLTLRIPITVQITTAPAFSLTVASTSVTLKQSSTATVGVNVGALTSNFNSPVTLTVSGLPSGVTGTFSSATLAAPGAGASTLTLTASAAAATGPTTFTITAIGGTITRTAGVQLTTTPPSSFSISASVPSYNVLAGSSFVETITAKGLYGYSSNVNLTTNALPTGLSATFATTSINGGSGATSMTIVPASTIAPGAYTITVTATDPTTNIAQSTTITLTVGSFTAALSPTSITVSRGSSASTILTTTASSYTGNILVTVASLPFATSASVSKSYIVGSGSSTVTISPSANATPGSYVVLVRATVGGATVTSSLTVLIH